MRSLLDGVVGQVDILVCELIQVVLLGARPQVALVVEVAAHDAIHRCQHAEDPDVELALIDEEGPFDVLLDDNGVLSIVIF